MDSEKRTIGDWSHVPAERLMAPSGMQKGMRVTRYDQIPTEALAEIAAVYGLGAQKYKDTTEGPNWLLGGPYSWHVRALIQHVEEFRSGIDYDTEDGASPLAHACWHAMALMTLQARGLGEDDRGKINGR